DDLRLPTVLARETLELLVVCDTHADTVAGADLLIDRRDDVAQDRLCFGNLPRKDQVLRAPDGVTLVGADARLEARSNHLRLDRFGPRGRLAVLKACRRRHHRGCGEQHDRTSNPANSETKSHSNSPLVR